MFFNNVIVPGISVLRSVSSFLWVQRQDAVVAGLKEENVFPRGYAVKNPTNEYVGHELVASLIRGDKPGFFQAPEYARKFVKCLVEEKFENKPFVTLTAREISRDDSLNRREIDKSVWVTAFDAMKSLGVVPTLVRDSSAAWSEKMFENVIELPEASLHLPFRQALYEHAKLNFSKNNGPTVLKLFGSTRTVCFNHIDNNVVALSLEWVKNNYGHVGNGQFPMTTTSKKFVWENETVEKILFELSQADDQVLKKDEINQIVSIENIAASFTVAARYLISNLRWDPLIEDVQLLLSLKKLNDKHSFASDFEGLLRSSIECRDMLKNLEVLFSKI